MKTFYIIASIGFLFLMIQSYKLLSNNLKTENQKYRIVLKGGKSMYIDPLSPVYNA